MIDIKHLEMRIIATLENDYYIEGACITPVEHKGISVMITRPYFVEGTCEGARKRLFVKLITDESIALWKFMQLMKNVYLIFSSKDMLFATFSKPQEMARHEFSQLNWMAYAGLDVPKVYGMNKLEENAVILVMERLNGVRELDEKITDANIDGIFAYIKKMHYAGISHGDIKLSNILIAEKIYLIDGGQFVDDIEPATAKAYDIACAMCALVPLAGTERVARAAKKCYSLDELTRSCEFFSLAQRRPTFDISNDDVKALKKMIENGA